MLRRGIRLSEYLLSDVLKGDEDDLSQKLKPVGPPVCMHLHFWRTKENFHTFYCLNYLLDLLPIPDNKRFYYDCRRLNDGWSIFECEQGKAASEKKEFWTGFPVTTDPLDLVPYLLMHVASLRIR